MGGEVDFLSADKHKKLIVCKARHAQSTQNNKFVLSLQYLTENVKDEVGFSLQISINGFFKLKYMWLGMPNYQRQQVFYFFAISYERSELSN